MEAHLGSSLVRDAVHADFTRRSFLPPPTVKFASNTALVHPQGVADRMFLVRCDLPPSPAA